MNCTNKKWRAANLAARSMSFTQLKKAISKLFMKKGANAAFVVDKFENYNKKGTIQESSQNTAIFEEFCPLDDKRSMIQESTQNTAVLEEYQPCEVEPGTVVDGVVIDATDDPELDVNEQEFQRKCNEALEEYIKADEALKQE